MIYYTTLHYIIKLEIINIPDVLSSLVSDRLPSSDGLPTDKSIGSVCIG